MVHCIACGVSNTEDSKFCIKCGVKLVKEQCDMIIDENERISEEFIACNHCGQENQKDSKFCTKCGEILVKNEQSIQNIAIQDEQIIHNSFQNEQTIENDQNIKKIDTISSEPKKIQNENIKTTEALKNEKIDYEILDDEILESPTDFSSKSESYEFYCEKCGVRNLEDVEKCINCGSSLKQDKPKLTEDLMEGIVILELKLTCPQCGIKNLEDSLFCRICGEKI